MSNRKAIKKELTDAFINDPLVIEKYGLIPGLTFEEQFSKVSVEDCFFNAISFSFDIHQNIVSTNAENSRPHTIRWYLEQAMSFLDGLELQWIDGQFKYDTTAVFDIELRKIIDRCAVVESTDGELVFKVAKDNSGVLSPLSAAEIVRFNKYLNLIKDAGNRIRIISNSADKLKATINVYVDVLVIDTTTGRQLNVEGNVFPVKDAIKNYLANLEFNGAFVRELFKDEISKSVGVKFSVIEDLQWKFGALPFVSIGEWKISEAGYFIFEDVDLTINYIPYVLD